MFGLFLVFALAFEEVSKKEEFCLFIIKQAGRVKAEVFTQALRELGKSQDLNALEKVKQIIFQKCFDDQSFEVEKTLKDAEFIKKKTDEYSPDLIALIENQSWALDLELLERIKKLEESIQKKYSDIRMNAFRASRAYREENNAL